MKKRKFLHVRHILIFTIFVFCSLSLSRALMIKLSLTRLSIEADAIIIGEVKEIQSQWSMDRSTILTIVTLQVNEILNGKIDSTQILIQYPGGEVGDIGLKVSDMPSFWINEKVLVFLKSLKNIQDSKNSPIIALNFLPAFSIFGAAQGKYSIDSNESAHKSGYSLNAKDSDPEMSLSLADLKRRIKSTLDKHFKEKEKTHEKINY